VNKKQKDHHEGITKENEQINHLREGIKTMQIENKEMMDQI